MKVKLELFGLARMAAGEKEILLKLEEGATFHDIVRVLSSRYPEMIGNVIKPDHKSLQPPNIFNLNAKSMIQPNQMDKCPSDGDRIILMSMSAGG